MDVRHKGTKINLAIKLILFQLPNFDWGHFSYVVEVGNIWSVDPIGYVALDLWFDCNIPGTGIAHI